jgi:hypothetical protein
VLPPNYAFRLYDREEARLHPRPVDVEIPFRRKA